MEEFLANVRACAPEYSPLHDMKDEEILNSKRCARDDQGAGIVSLYVLHFAICRRCIQDGNLCE